MGNQIILKKSSVGAKVPLTTDLAFGELALNYSDGKLYYKDSSNAIQAFQSGSGTVSSLASFDRKLYVISTAGTNTLAVNYAVGYVDVFVNGVKLNSTEFTATNGVSVTITLLSVNDEVQLVGIKPVNVGSVSTKYNRSSYTATAGQTTFTITYSRTSTMSYVEVHVNGIFIDTSEYTATTGTSITLVTAAAAGDIVDLVGLQDFQMFDLLVTGTGLGYNNTTGTISLASSTAATANTVALRDGSGNLTANAISATGLTVFGTSGRYFDALGGTAQIRLAASEGGWINSYNFTANNGTVLGGISAGGSGQTMSYLALNATSTNAESMRIDSAGRVMIATQSAGLGDNLTLNGGYNQNGLKTRVRQISTGASAANINLCRVYYDSVNWGTSGVLVEIFSTSPFYTQMDYGMYYARVGYSGDASGVTTKIAGPAAPYWSAVGINTGNFHYQDLIIPLPTYAGYDVRMTIVSNLTVTTNLAGPNQNSAIYIY